MPCTRWAGSTGGICKCRSLLEDIKPLLLGYGLFGLSGLVYLLYLWGTIILRRWFSLLVGLYQKITVKLASLEEQKLDYFAL